MSIQLTERWFFRAEDTPTRIERFLRSLASGRSIQLLADKSADSRVFVVRCPDDIAVYELLDALGVDLMALAETAFEQDCDDDVSAGADMRLMVHRDWDGSFEWIVEAEFDDTKHWPLTLVLGRALADRFSGKPYDELTNEELVAGQTMWMAPPPIVKVTRPN